MTILLATALFAFALAFVLGLALGFFRAFFAVAEDPLVSRIRAALPGANCGACGFPGCDGYAAAVAGREASAGRCAPGGAETAARLAALVGADAAAEAVRQAAALACRGTREHAPLKGIYTGVLGCRAAKLSSNGTKLCAWACLGFGDCAAVCRFGALSIGADGLPRIDLSRCTGCGACVAECPQAVLRLVPLDRAAPFMHCSNRNPVKAAIIKTCKNACIKCGLCVKICPRHCIAMDQGLPSVDAANCDGCGLCAAKCPTKALF